MKPGITSKPFPTRPEDITSAIAAAPEQVNDPDCPYDPNVPEAVEAFWKNATVRPGKRPVPLPPSRRTSAL